MIKYTLSVKIKFAKKGDADMSRPRTNKQISKTYFHVYNVDKLVSFGTVWTIKGATAKSEEANFVADVVNQI